MHICGIFKSYYRYIDYKKGNKHLKTLCTHLCIYVCMCVVCVFISCKIT